MYVIKFPDRKRHLNPGEKRSFGFNTRNSSPENAKQLYKFAEQYRGKYSDSITDARRWYGSNDNLEDELAWGAIWLYKATKNSDYLKKAEKNNLIFLVLNGMI